MITGYEGRTFRELEQEVDRTQNLLAMEVIERVERASPECLAELLEKPRTKYTDGSTS